MAPADGSASVYHCALQSRDHEPYALATVGSRTERTKRRFKAPPGESGARRDTASRHQQGRAGGPGGSAPLPGPPLPRKGSPAEAGLKDLCLKPQGGNVGVRHNVSTLHDSPRAAIRPRFRGASPGRRQPARVRSSGSYMSDRIRRVAGWGLCWGYGGRDTHPASRHNAGARKVFRSGQPHLREQP